MLTAVGCLCIFVALGVSTGRVVAANSTTAGASVTVLRSITVTKTADLSFGRFQNQAGKSAGTVTITSAPPASVTSNGVILVPGNSNPSPAIFSIRGEPNRAYVASVPSGVTSTPGGFPLSAFTFWSQNSGTLAGGAGHFSASGTDTLRVGGTVTVPAKTPINTYGAIVPVTISYQ